MIATCKFCQHIVTPVAVLPLKPAQLAKMPPEQLEIMKFSTAVTDHVRQHHPEFIQLIQQLAGNFLGHCTLSTVSPVGNNHRQFAAICAADDAQLRAYWDAMPNPPHPDVLAQLAGEAQAQLAMARAADEKEQGGAGGSVPVPPPPGPILLT